MADARIRRASIWVGSKKVAECHQSTVTISSGDELAYGDDGVIGVTDGAGSLSVEFDAVVPISGMTVNPESDLIAKRYVTVQLGVVNGKIITSNMRYTKADYKSNAQTGRLDGSFSLIGPLPTLTP